MLLVDFDDYSEVYADEDGRGGMSTRPGSKQRPRVM